MSKLLVIAAALASTMSILAADPPSAAARTQAQKALPGGLGVTALRAGNYPEALRLLTAGADQGDALSMFYLAGLYARGDGVQADGARAIALYRRAAEAGDNTPLGGSTVSGQSMYALAKIYNSGRLAGVRANDAEANIWYGRWAATVDPRAVPIFAPRGSSSSCVGALSIMPGPGEYDSTTAIAMQARSDQMAMCRWQAYMEQPSPRSLPTPVYGSGVRLP